MNNRLDISPDDEPGHLRAGIKSLKDSKARLKGEVTASGQTAGTDFEVTISDQTRQTFDRKALPQETQGDERYWETSTTRIVRTVPVRDPDVDTLIDDEEH